MSITINNTMYDYYGKMMQQSESTPTAPAIDFSPFKTSVMIGDSMHYAKNQYEYNHILRYSRKVQKMKNCINNMYLFNDLPKELVFKINNILYALHEKKHSHDKNLYDFKINTINEYIYKNTAMIRSTNKSMTDFNIQRAKMNMIKHIYKPLHRYDFGRKNDIRYEKKQLEYYAMIAHQNIFMLCAQLEHSYKICTYVFTMNSYRCF
jgi:hypothetical protein